MTDKYLRISMPNGVLFDVDAQHVANHWAITHPAMFAETSLHKADILYKELFQQAINDDDNLILWARDFGWEYLEQYAKRVDEANYATLFRTAKVELKSK